jgi:hypothetical protein
MKSPAPPFCCCSPRHIIPIVVDSGSRVAASLDRGNILSPGDAGFWGVAWIGASTAVDGMEKAALGGMGKATLGGMVKARIGVPGALVKKPPAATTSATVTSTEGTQRPLSVIAVAIKLGFIAPVVPTTGGVGQDEERAASGEAGRGEAVRGGGGQMAWG